MQSILSEPQFHNEAAAFAFVEAWLWPNGPVCPFCEASGDRIGRLTGKTTRLGLCKCYGCRKQFTVRIGTVFESSHAPLRVWLQAIYLLCSSKKGISTRQLQRTLQCGLKTAWFLGMRIREAMAPATDAGPLGGPDVIVETDETELSPSTKTWRRKDRNLNKKFVSLVERGGRVHSRKITGAEGPIGIEVRKVLYAHLHPDSTLHTDGAVFYKYALASAKHEAVNHSKEFARTAEDGSRVHCNSAEGYFSIFKRGLVGTYQHMSEQHLHRYLAEFDFRMNTRERLGVDDKARAVKALQGVVGKRLTYRTADRKTA